MHALVVVQTKIQTHSNQRKNVFRQSVLAIWPCEYILTVTVLYYYSIRPSRTINIFMHVSVGGVFDHMKHTETKRLGCTGETLFTVKYLPDQKPKAALCFHHGLGEHIGRYQRGTIDGILLL